MIPYDFDYYRPDTLEEAIDLYKKLKISGQKALYYGGGTEFISMSRLNNIYTDAVIDIKGIPESSVYEIEGDELIIGAGLTLTQVAEENLFPLMSLAIKRIADHTVQGKVTIGGNLMGSIIYREASLAPLVANAEILVGNGDGVNRVDFNKYWNSPIEDKEGDLIIQLIIKKRYLDLPYIHVKRTKNEKIDYPLISAVALKDGKKINIAFSGLCEKSFRLKEIEKALNSKSREKGKRINEIIQLIPGELLDDNNGTPDYRKFMLANIIEEIIDKFERGEESA